jgi:hypothetical protein
VRRHHLLLLGILALAPGTALAVPAYTVTDLGTLGGGNSAGVGINVRSQVAGASYRENHAFLLTPVTVAEVPEPGTLALMGTGIIGLGLLWRRKGLTDTATQAPAT